MNCPHSGDGWCLDCVKDLWESKHSIVSLYEMIKEWKMGSIEKCPDDMVRDCNSKYVDELRERVGPDYIILSFSGADSGLFGRGYVIAIDEQCNVIDCIATLIS